jgi:GNAT superfamily N-acetyltransferase
MRTEKGDGYDVRPYGEDDETRVIELLSRALGAGPSGERSAEFFRWKHVRNPFGRSYMIVADAGERIIGLRAFMRWEFHAAGRTVRAVRAVDTATDPDYQGRGVFSRLTKTAVEALRGDVDLVFNTPNEFSGPGYLKLGWRLVGRIPVSIRVRRPLRFLTKLRSLREADEGSGAMPPVDAEPASAVLGPQADPAPEDEVETEPRLSTRRDHSFLRWRYVDIPGIDYWVARGERAGRRGLAIFRVRRRGRLLETSVADVIVPQEDASLARALFRRTVRAAPSDHVACHFPAGSTQLRAARRGGFLRAPGGPIFVVNPLSEGIEPDPMDLRSWALSLGDLEVF